MGLAVIEGFERDSKTFDSAWKMFLDLDDLRDSNAGHNLHEVLIIAIRTMPWGREDCGDMALLG